MESPRSPSSARSKRLTSPLRSCARNRSWRTPFRGDEARVLDRIAGLQRADGSWDLDADFVAAVGIGFLKLKAAVENEDNLETASRAATAVALVFLCETYAAKEQVEWRMLGKKATKWLAKQSAPKAGGTWLEIAKELFRVI